MELLKMITSPIKNAKPSADTLEKYKGLTREQLLNDLEHLERTINCIEQDIYCSITEPLDQSLSILTLIIEQFENDDFNKIMIRDSLGGVKRLMARAWVDSLEIIE